MKKLYSFIIPQEVVVENPHESTNEAGEKVTVLKKEKTIVNRKFFLRKADRELVDDGQLYCAAKTAELIRKGCLTKAMLSKRLINDGGALSEKETAEYKALYDKFFEKGTALQKLLSIKDDARTEEDKTQKAALEKEVVEIRQKLQEYEFAVNRLYDQTAESIAHAKTTLWWLINLSYEEGAKDTQFFGEGTYEQRLARHDEMFEKADPFTMKVVRHLGYAASLWYNGGASKQEEFDEAVKAARLELDI